MKRVAMLWTLLLAAVAGCASGGGPVGTGISSSSVSGNVVEVQSEATAATAGQLPGAAIERVTISIDEAGVETATDDDGNFELSGGFAGPLTLRFATARFQVTAAIELPAGSAIVLADIVLRPGQVQAQTVRQLGFVGRIDLVDCDASELLVTDLNGDGHQFLVRLTPDTEIVDRNERPLRCSELHSGDQVSAEGPIHFQGDRTISAVRIVRSPPPPLVQPVREVRFVGVLEKIDCPAELLVIDDGVGHTRLRLTPATTIRGLMGQGLRCTDLRLGMRLAGKGRIQLRRPGTIEATHLVVMPRPVAAGLRYTAAHN